jgi:hypothetical protein
MTPSGFHDLMELVYCRTRIAISQKYIPGDLEGIRKARYNVRNSHSASTIDVSFAVKTR